MPELRTPLATLGRRLRGGRRARAVLSMLLLISTLAGPSAWAGGKDDHNRARAAVQAGEVLPLPSVLEQLQRSYPGEVLELDLEREDGRWIYEVKLLQADGRLLKLEVDARTAQVLTVERKDKGKDRPKDPRRGEDSR